MDQDLLPSLTALRAFEAAARTGSISAAAREGLGLHVEHLPIVASDLAQGRLVAVYTEPPDPGGAGHWIVTRPGPARPALRAFVRWLKSVA